MLFSIMYTLFFLSVNVVCQSPRFNTLQEFVQSHELIATPASPVTYVHHESPLNDVTEFMKSVTAVLVALTGLLSIICPCWCIIRCIKKGGKMKKQWFYPKSLTEYRRRQEIDQRRVMALDRLATLSSSLESSA